MGFFGRARSSHTAKTTHPPAREYFYLGESLALTRLKCGHFIYVDPLEESVCSHLIAHGAWEPWARELVLGLVGPGDHVVEVGGHVGYYTIGLAHKVGLEGSVTTFEANPRMASLAQRSVRFNGYADRARIIQKAASDKAGKIRFTTSRQFAGGGHLFLREGMLGRDAETIEVDAVRLDDVKLPRVKLLRIDAEGSEGMILKGAERLLDTDELIICMEWDQIQLRSRTDPRELADWLAGKGFRFWQVTTDATAVPRKVEELAELSSCDIILAREDIFADRVG